MEKTSQYQLDEDNLEKLQSVFANRSAAMKTRAGKFKLKEQAYKVKQTLRGLTASEYWTTSVKTREDMQAYYQAIHPEYPETLIEAICDRVQALVDKYNENGQQLSALTQQEQSMLVRSITEDPISGSSWNPDRDIQREFIKAKVCQHHLPHGVEGEHTHQEEGQEEEGTQLTACQTDAHENELEEDDNELSNLQSRILDELQL